MTVIEGAFQQVTSLYTAAVDAIVDITQGAADYPEENVVYFGMEDGPVRLLFTINNDDTFVSGTAFDDVRQDIIDNLTATGSPTFGWNNEIRDNLAVTDVVRLSDTQFEINIDHNHNYDLGSSNEDVTATIPAAAFTNATEDQVASPTIEIIADQNNSISGSADHTFTCNAPQVTGGRERVVATLCGMTQAERDAIHADALAILNVPTNNFRVNLATGVQVTISASTEQVRHGGSRGSAPTDCVFYVNFIQYNPDCMAIHMYIGDEYGGTNKTSYFTDLGFSGGESLYFKYND